jgi:hypothetical protein
MGHVFLYFHYYSKEKGLLSFSSTLVGEEKKTCEHVRQLLEQRGGGEGGQPLLLSLLSWLLTTLSLQYPDKQVQSTKNCGRDSSAILFLLTEANTAF